MAMTSVCPRCGRELSSDAPRGLCPACLFEIALEREGPVPIVETLGSAERADQTPGFPCEDRPLYMMAMREGSTVRCLRRSWIEGGWATGGGERGPTDRPRAGVAWPLS
jgi:hypothetical protein